MNREIKIPRPPIKEPKIESPLENELGRIPDRMKAMGVMMKRGYMPLMDKKPDTAIGTHIGNAF